MNELTEYGLHCPYCDASITVLIDGSIPSQSYVEDCEVCCRPIVLDITVPPDGDCIATAQTEDQ